MVCTVTLYMGYNYFPPEILHVKWSGFLRGNSDIGVSNTPVRVGGGLELKTTASKLVQHI